MRTPSARSTHAQYPSAPVPGSPLARSSAPATAPRASRSHWDAPSWSPTLRRIDVSSMKRSMSRPSIASSCGPKPRAHAWSTTKEPSAPSPRFGKVQQLVLAIVVLAVIACAIIVYAL